MSREPGVADPTSGRRILIAAAATFGVVTWWAMRGATPAANPGTADTARVEHSPRAFGADTPPSTDAADPIAPTGAAVFVASDDPAATDPAFAAYVDRKYKYLPRSPTLAKELLERERIAVAINTAKQSADETEKQTMPQLQAQLAEADRKVAGLLAPGDVAGYDMLKNSDMDQFQFEDYVGGISNVAPLAEEKKQAILYAKLSNRYRFNQALETSGLMRGDLTPAQRHAALTSVSRALRESKDGFLQEARQHLHDEEQFTLLSDYENSEFSGELDKLRRIAEGAGEGA
jgi:hypothetical protein